MILTISTFGISFKITEIIIEKNGEWAASKLLRKKLNPPEILFLKFSTNGSKKK